jgi:ribosomal protein L22
MSENFSQGTEVKAVAKRIRMAPNKIRRVLRQIQGKSYKEALTLIEFLPYSSCKPALGIKTRKITKLSTRYILRGRT